MENNTEDKGFMTKYQTETAGAAAVELLKIIGAQDNLFVFANDEETKKKNAAALTAVLAKVLEVFAEKKVGYTNYDFVFESMKIIISDLQSFTKNHFSNLRRELDSRFVGAKNPKSGKYDIDHATHIDMIMAVNKIREVQGNNPWDFFFKAEEQKEEDVVSPIQPKDL